jgi:hypothetical protein
MNQINIGEAVGTSIYYHALGMRLIANWVTPDVEKKKFEKYLDQVNERIASIKASTEPEFIIGTIKDIIVITEQAFKYPYQKDIECFLKELNKLIIEE